MSSDRTGSQSARRSAMCAELIGLLHEQEQICRRLLDISTEERTAVVAGRLGDLERSTGEKNRLVEQMDHLEQRRRGLAERLARDLALPVDTPLAGLASRMPGEEADDLLEMRSRVTETVARLREANDINLTLMRRSLELVRESIRQLHRSTGTGNAYTSDGRPAVGLRGNMVVDCHA